MFKFLKNKISKWIKGIKKEKVSEEAKVLETKEKPEEKPKKIEKKKEKPEEIEQIKAKEEKPEKKAIEEKPKKEKPEKAEIEETKEAIEDIKEERLAEELTEELKEEKQVEIKKEEEKEIEETKEHREIEEKKPEKKGFFKALKAKFTTTKLTEEDFKKQFNELGTELAENNVAIETIDEIKKRLEESIVEKEIKKQELETKIKEALKQTISSLLIEPFDVIEKIKEKSKRQEQEKEKKPFVIVFFGINGSGKTTSVAKLASFFLKNDFSCVIAASDTFRAASIEQLEMHAKKLNVKLIKHDYGADPAAVAFDAIKYAKAKNIKIVLIDTAGRMHTSQNLLNEMEKICRVTKPDLRIFVAESITGNDAIAQARNFSESVGIDGIILTKADVDEKGGTAVSIGHITGKPILFLGVGQKYSDLEKFDKNKLLKALGF